MGTLVIARQQTAGRGRLGRSWESPPDAGIYMSVILRPPNKAIYEIPLLTIAAGVAAATAIHQTTGITIGLKWVNDLICDGLKVGGILAETSGASAPYVVLGMGVNVNLDPAILPDELRERVTSLHLHTTNKSGSDKSASDLPKPGAIDPNTIVAAICNQFENLWSQLQESQADQILAEWRRRTVTLGHRIKATIGERTLEGLAEDITTTGALKVRIDDGKLVELTAGEIQIRRADGAYC